MLAVRACTYEVGLYPQQAVESGDVAGNDRIGRALECGTTLIAARDALDVMHELRPAREPVCARNDELRLRQATVRSSHALAREFRHLRHATLHVGAAGVGLQLAQLLDPAPRPFDDGIVA